MRTRLALAVLAFVTLLPHLASAQGIPRYHVDLTLEPMAAGGLLGGAAGGNGLTLVLPSEGDNVTLFGLSVGIGGLITRMIEVGGMLNLAVASGANNDVTLFGLRPFLKVNFWATPHVNPFIQPFAGFLIASDGQSQTLFDGGFFGGVDLLVTSWGIRLFTGFEALANDNGHIFSVPFHWALVAYF